MRKVIFSGSFYPVTLGHISLIEKAEKLFDEIIVLVADNSDKKHLFNLDERMKNE